MRPVPETPAEALHRNGQMIAGGSGYSLAELALLNPLPLHPCGFPSLDELTGGGLAPGAVWTVAGPTGVGVTSLVSATAVAAGRSARVALANDHLATHLLRDRLQSASGKVAIASWVPLPDYRSAELSWFGANYDLLIIDCLDEMLRPAAWPKSASAISHGRWLRELARRSNTALVLTGRAERPRSSGRGAFERSWHSHWSRPVFDDIADVQIQLWPDRNSNTRFLATARGLGELSGTAHLHGGGPTLQPD